MLHDKSCWMPFARYLTCFDFLLHRNPYLFHLLRIGYIMFWSHRKQRLFSGFLTACLGFFLTFTFLEPLFDPVNSDTAFVFLYVLAIYGATVGGSLGVLLPLVFPGICFGAVLALLIGSFFQHITYVANQQYFPIVGGVLATIFAFFSSR